MVSFSRAATEKKNNLALIKSEILTAEEVEEEKRGEEVEIIPEAAQISVDSLIDMKEEKVREEEWKAKNGHKVLIRLKDFWNWEVLFWELENEELM